MNVLIKYKERDYINTEFQELYGSRRLVDVNKVVDYEQEEVVQVGTAIKRIKELKSFSNRNYHSFKIEAIS